MGQKLYQMATPPATARGAAAPFGKRTLGSTRPGVGRRGRKRGAATF
ncbi:hypothetical protein [Nonomuraea turkmeniaca]|nr:hypothetical protein [Nonomuraea turkmeniaca]